MIDETGITETIKKELSKMLNNNNIKTQEKANAIAGRLLRHGTQPTWRLIREILGTGSATTLQKVVNQYWLELGNYLDKLEKRPELPESLVTEFNSIWDNALQCAEKEAQNSLEDEFKKVKAIEDKIQEENKLLTDKLESENRLKVELEQQFKQLEIAYETQQVALDQSKQSQQTLKEMIANNKKEFSRSLEAQQQNYAEKHTQLQQSYHVLEQSLEQVTQQLATSESQRALAERQSQQAMAEFKHDKQRELDRQAKQYDSMLEHYSHEIGQLKVKLDSAEKRHTKEKKSLQSQHENDLIKITELQSNVMTLAQKNEYLEKENLDQRHEIKEQSLELKRISKEHVILETRFEALVSQ